LRSVGGGRNNSNSRGQFGVCPRSKKMAFEVPLEADRVDDLNFFSTVWRAPVIGTIFWILGGDKARRVEEEQETKDLHPSAGGDSVDGGDDRDAGFSQEERLSAAADDNMKRSFSRRSSLKKNTPSLADSEVSELADVGESLEGLSLSKGKHGHRKKELSWSDESGKDLAEIIHEVSYYMHCLLWWNWLRWGEDGIAGVLLLLAQSLSSCVHSRSTTVGRITAPCCRPVLQSTTIVGDVLPHSCAFAARTTPSLSIGLSKTGCRGSGSCPRSGLVRPAGADVPKALIASQ
jgi:hypothetical protein